MNTLRRTKMVAAIHVSFCLPRGLFVPTYLPVFPLSGVWAIPTLVGNSGGYVQPASEQPQQLSPANLAAP